MFALAPIWAGEILVIWGGTVFTRAEVEAGAAAEGSTVPIGEDIYLGSPAGTYDRERDDHGDFINHSCDPSVWMQDEVTSVARRAISENEELTMDYAMIREDDSLVARFACLCGSPLCRGKVTGRDWRLPELEARYEGRFSLICEGTPVSTGVRFWEIGPGQPQFLRVRSIPRVARADLHVMSAPSSVWHECLENTSARRGRPALSGCTAA
jgi:hypothetical protein